MAASNFILKPGGTATPTSDSIPSPSPTAMPTEIGQVYSVQYDINLAGITANQAQSNIPTLSGILCDYINADPADCQVIGLEDTGRRLSVIDRSLVLSTIRNTLRRKLDLSSYGTLMTVVANAYLSENAASQGTADLTSFVNDITATGYAAAVNNETDLSVSSSVMSDVVDILPGDTSTYDYSCVIQESYTLYWSVDIQSSPTYVRGMLQISDESSWISGGTVLDGSKTMVASPNHYVFLYDSNTASVISEYITCTCLANIFLMLISYFLIGICSIYYRLWRLCARGLVK